MAYTQLSETDAAEMLRRIGVREVRELFDGVPEDLRLHGPLALAEGLSEDALLSYMRGLADKNGPAGRRVSFLGAGIYDHYVPAVVDEVAARGEFYSSYTPYQPEVSQGNLQAFFEYQSLAAELFGTDVSNASLYDGATAVVEAVLMALDAVRPPRKRILVSEGVHPEYRQVLTTYLRHSEVVIETAPTPGGTTEFKGTELGACAALVLANPNFYGCIEACPPWRSALTHTGPCASSALIPSPAGCCAVPARPPRTSSRPRGSPWGSPPTTGG
ncbi:MAG: hypothetical protein V2A58_00630 [Planctomycetota bacterium]